MASDLIERLESSAKAFRENTVYDSEGDPLRLIVQAEEMDEATARIRELEAALKPFAEVARHDIGDDEGDTDRFKPAWIFNVAPVLTVGHLRAACQALGGDNG